MKLTDKQKEVISCMMNGYIIHKSRFQEALASLYKDGATPIFIHKNTFKALLRMGIIDFKESLSVQKSAYVLTELGKNIEL